VGTAITKAAIVHLGEQASETGNSGAYCVGPEQESLEQDALGVTTAAHTATMTNVTAAECTTTVSLHRPGHVLSLAQAACSIAAASKQNNPPLSRRRPLRMGAALAFSGPNPVFWDQKRTKPEP
jgi:hypothetical protein